ncbi:unnamed protein product, partial [Closterium sp. NIES-54]
ASRAAPCGPPFASATRKPPLQPRAPPLQPRALPLAALSPPLHPRAPPLAARPLPLGPRATPLAACAPPLAARLPPLAAACPVPCAARLLPALRAVLWLDNLQLNLLSDTRDSVLLFDHTPGASLAPPVTADNATRSQWLTRDVAARLAICNHLGQHKTAKALYDTIVARYSSPAPAALGRLLLPYLFPELSAFATVEDLVNHLRTSDARYCQDHERE